jgi:hypothetical protein
MDMADVSLENARMANGAASMDLAADAPLKSLEELSGMKPMLEATLMVFACPDSLATPGEGAIRMENGITTSMILA